jgi:hypothetical protein
MLREPTIEKLQALRLGAMAAAWEEQQRSADVVALASTNASGSWSTPSGSRARTSA